MMERLKSRFGWALAGALGIVLVLALARATLAGPLDPPGSVGSTMRTIDELLPSWGRTLTSSGGCTSQRFTCVLSNAAVLDHETGLVWERVPSTQTLLYPDADLQCSQFTITAGRAGWRLPTLLEIQSLVDTSTTDSLPPGHPFTMTSDVDYWTQTLDVTDGQFLQTHVFLNGGNGLLANSRSRSGDLARAWCVRGQTEQRAQLPDDQPAWARLLVATGGCHSARFTCIMPTNANPTGEAVLDHETGLAWQRTAGPGFSQNWTDVNRGCLLATTGGRRGWRSPTISEGFSLADPSTSALPSGHPFLGTSTSVTYVTSSSEIATLGYAFSITGGLSTIPKTTAVSATASWCVRGAGGDDPE